MPPEEVLASSFRDPAGYVFRDDGVIYRAIRGSVRSHYDMLMSSGLYDELVAANLLVSHEEVKPGAGRPGEIYKIIRPEEVPFISYPYEWSFSQIQDAAAVTLEIEKRALRSGMTLVDASAYNIQFHQGPPSPHRYPLPAPGGRRGALDGLRAVLPSFSGAAGSDEPERCPSGTAPSRSSRRHPARPGIVAPPPSFAETALSAPPPASSRAEPETLRGALRQRSRRGKVSRQALLGLVDSLEAGIKRLHWRPSGTEWADYYADTNYSPEGLDDKLRAVQDFIGEVRPRTVWDLGGNIGTFSRIAAAAGESHHLIRHRPGLRRNQLPPKPPGKGNEPPPPPPRRDQSEPWRRLGEHRDG